MALRLCVAVVAGGMIGVERRSASRPAGIRTLALVSLGATTFTLVSVFGFTQGDVSRVAAQVASGVGFIGAGVIGGGSGGRDKTALGLSTASAIWVAAALGVASGVGMHGVAVCGSVLTVLILRGGKIKPLRRDARRDGGGRSALAMFPWRLPILNLPHVTLGGERSSGTAAAAATGSARRRAPADDGRDASAGASGGRNDDASGRAAADGRAYDAGAVGAPSPEGDIASASATSVTSSRVEGE